MKTKLHITLTVVILTLAACKRQQTPETRPAPEVPAMTPSGIQRPAPTATPDQSPVAAPTAPAETQSATPQGIYYVVKRFSVATADGLHGFSEGKQVTLVREEGSDLIVTDGVVEGKAPKDSFSTDRKVIEIIQKNQTISAAKVQATQDANAQEVKMKTEKAEKERQENVNAAKLNRIQSQIQQLDANISAASEELHKVYQAKARGGNIYNSYGDKIGVRATSASGDYHQLENNISLWKQQKAALQQQIK